MIKAATIFGMLLIANGLYGYLYGDPAKESVTALIPAFVGIVIFLCGVGSVINQNWRKHLMHFSAGIGLLGGVASGYRLFVTLGEENADAFAQQNLAIMLILCAGYVGICLGSFSASRDRQESSNK